MGVNLICGACGLAHFGVSEEQAALRGGFEARGGCGAGRLHFRPLRTGEKLPPADRPPIRADIGRPVKLSSLLGADFIRLDDPSEGWNPDEEDS